MNASLTPRAGARALLLPAAQPLARRAAGAPVPAEQNLRRPVRQPGAGSHLGRRGLRARTGRLDRADDPQYRRAAGARLPAARHPDAAHGARRPRRRRARTAPATSAILQVRHVVAPISMLGDLIPVMTGVAMAGRYLGQKIVAMTWIGDGGTSTGAFHEGMNLAAVQKAPLVVVVENNQWAYSTPVSRQVPLRDLADRARAYGIASAHRGRQRRGGGGAARRAQAVAQARDGRRPGADRSQDHAHDAATRSTTPPSMCRAKCWTTGRRAIRSTRFEKYLTRQSSVGRRNARRHIDARIERELAEDLAFAESFAVPAAGTRRAGRLLRRLPHDRSAVAAAQGRSDAAASRACRRPGRSRISATSQPRREHRRAQMPAPRKARR